jgi:hypothetical protein
MKWSSIVLAYIRGCWGWGNEKPYPALPEWFYPEAWDDVDEVLPDEDDVMDIAQCLQRL